MMGRLNRDQGQFLYCFNLEEVVPEDHMVRAIAGVLDLSWVYGELAPYYSGFGRPSLDPVLMIRMLICRLRLCNSIRAGVVPGCSGQPGLPMVLWPEP